MVTTEEKTSVRYHVTLLTARVKQKKDREKDFFKAVLADKNNRPIQAEQ